MSDLVRELELLGTDIDWPRTPGFAPRAAAAERAPAGRRRRVPRRRLALVLALVVLALAAAALAATGVIHFGGATIHRVDRLPPVDPVPHLALGTPIRVAEAERLLPLRLPPHLRAPDAAYQDERGVSLVYLDQARRPRAILAVLREGTGLLDKLVSLRTRIRRVRVEGVPGLYIAGPHVVDFLYGPGRRLSRPTLLWSRDGLLYRLESGDALALASAG